MLQAHTKTHIDNIVLKEMKRDFSVWVHWKIFETTSPLTVWAAWGWARGAGDKAWAERRFRFPLRGHTHAQKHTHTHTHFDTFFSSKCDLEFSDLEMTRTFFLRARRSWKQNASSTSEWDDDDDASDIKWNGRRGKKERSPLMSETEPKLPLLLWPLKISSRLPTSFQRSLSKSKRFALMTAGVLTSDE